MYGGALKLKATLDYDFSVEKDFSYKNLSANEIIKHLAVFVARLLQIHMIFLLNTRGILEMHLFVQTILI